MADPTFLEALAAGDARTVTPLFAAAISGLVGMIFGGLAGAVYTNRRIDQRAAKPKIGRAVEVYPILHPKPEGSSLDAQVRIDHEGRDHTFSNLFLVRLTLRNQSLTDFARFPLRVTMAHGETVVFHERERPSPSHELGCAVPPIPGKPASECDFVLEPFNRDDEYELRLFVVGGGDDGPSAPTLSTSLPACFVEPPRLDESLLPALEAALGAQGLWGVAVWRALRLTLDLRGRW